MLGFLRLRSPRVTAAASRSAAFSASNAVAGGAASGAITCAAWVGAGTGTIGGGIAETICKATRVIINIIRSGNFWLDLGNGIAELVRLPRINTIKARISSNFKFLELGMYKIY